MKANKPLFTVLTVMSLPMIALLTAVWSAHSPLGIVTVFVGGLLTAFTPCVYPVIPLVLAQASNARERSTGNSLLHATLLVCGMTITYTLLGIVAGLGNTFFGSWTSSGLFTAVATGLMWLFALGMLGAYTFQLPHRLTTWAGNSGTTGYLGAFLTGALSGLLCAGCTGPVLAGILTYIAASQSPYQAATLMFVFALGMGVPFFILSVTASVLPKPGRWMIWFEGILGVILLGAGAWFFTKSGVMSHSRLSVVTPAVWWITGVALSVAGTAFWIRGHTTGTHALSRLTNLVIAVVIAAGMIFFWTGLNARAEAGPDTLNWKTVTTEMAFQRETEQHRGQLVFIDFHASWCGDCLEMERDVLHHPEIAPLLNRNFILIRVDASENTEQVKPIARRFGAQGVPSFRFLKKNGSELIELRTDGPLSKNDFKVLLKKAISSGNNKKLQSTAWVDRFTVKTDFSPKSRALSENQSKQG